MFLKLMLWSAGLKELIKLLSFPKIHSIQHLPRDQKVFSLMSSLSISFQTPQLLTPSKKDLLSFTTNTVETSCV